MFFRVILGPFLILSVIYLLLSGFSLLRACNIFQSKNTFSLGMVFYIVLLIHCLYRTVSSVYMTVLSCLIELYQEEMNYNFSKIFINTLYIPDILFWAGFLLLLWQLFVLFRKGHLPSKDSLFKEQYVQENQLSYQVFIIAILLGTGTQVVMISLYNLDLLYVFTFVIENAIYNLVIPIILIIIEIVLHIQFSGTPYRSIFDMKNKEKINKRIMFWGMTRSLQGILDLIFSASRKPTIFENGINFNSEDEEIESILFMVSIIASKIITEIVPFIMVFDYDFISVFFQSKTLETNELEINFIDDTLKKSASNEENINNSNISSSVKRSFNIIDELDINIKQIDFNTIYFDEINKEKKRNNGLGKLRLGYMNKEKTIKLCVRRIDIPKHKFSKYIMEETLKDMSKYLTLQTIFRSQLVNFKGYYFSPNAESLILFSQFHCNGSLNSIIHGDRKQSQKQETKSEADIENSQISITETIKTSQPSHITQLTYEFKLKTMLKIAKIMSILHSHDNPAVHGHLSPNNILLTDKYEPIISDLGLNSLKKYCKILIGYSNKNEYTAPEYLAEKGLIVDNARPAADVYSFGMIFWEILTEQKPFKNLKKDEIIDKVVKENCRPKIPETIPNDIRQIIRVCWQEDEKKRPSFSNIVKSLKEYL